MLSQVGDAETAGKGEKALPRAFITPGPRNFWRPASGVWRATRRGRACVWNLHAVVHWPDPATPIEETAQALHAAQLDKRAKKFAQFDPGKFWGDVWGEGETAILTFGSGIGPAQEAARRLAAAGRPTRVVSLRVLSPLPLNALARALDGAKRIVVMEQNHGAQLYQHLLAHKAIPPSAESIARPGPLPFRPAEITAHLA